jgi:hypothetical protein
MGFFRRFARLTLATVLTGIGAALIVPAPAGAEVSAELAAACEDAFRGPTDAEVKLVTDPPARSDARPGQEVRVDASWVAGAWESLSSVAACVRVNRAVDTALSSSESPTVDDGFYGHMFAVPEGLFNGATVCTRIRLAGDPVGEATEAVWVSRQACLEVHPEEAPPPTTTPTTVASTSPPAPAPTSPPAQSPAPAPAPTPVRQPVPAPPPAGPVSSVDEAPLPRPPAAPATDHAVPGQGTAGDGDTASTRMPESASLGPLALPVLPRTGAGTGGLTRMGLVAVATGVPVLILGRRRYRRRSPVL